MMTVDLVTPEGLQAVPIKADIVRLIDDHGYVLRFYTATKSSERLVVTFDAPSVSGWTYGLTEKETVLQ